MEKIRPHDWAPGDLQSSEAKEDKMWLGLWVVCKKIRREELRIWEAGDWENTHTNHVWVIYSSGAITNRGIVVWGR